VTHFNPRIDFTALGDVEIAGHGLLVAEVVFNNAVSYGLTNGDSLAIVVGFVNDEGVWRELGRRFLGPDGYNFLGNISPQTGKLVTALRHEMDSIEANQLHGDVIPIGPMRYTGAVWHVARVQTVENGWMTRVFAGAASGVQGHFDQATVYTALTRMGALWAIKMQALHGKP
jgi:hypothetical protein